MLDRPDTAVRRLVAPNPAPMAGPGTNGYIVGEEVVAVIDPGPDDDRHLAAWHDALRGREVSHILVTHAHLDHSGLARRLSDALGASQGSGAGMRGGPRRCSASPDCRESPGAKGVDRSFDPDLHVGDGQTFTGPGWRIEAMHTPGHFAGHLAFAIGDVVLTGDHVLGWTSTVISPPDGDLRQFLASCDRLGRFGARMLLPGHGDPIADPRGRLEWLANHRRTREAQILAVLKEGPAKVDDLLGRLYTSAPPGLRPAAARNVLAHLVALFEEGRVVASQ